MAIITDLDDLNQGVEITIDPIAREITLNLAGNLSTDGVSLAAVFSFLKVEWKNDPALIAQPFPLDGTGAIGQQFVFIDDWVPSNEETRTLFRTAGWQEITAQGAIKREYLGAISLDSGASTIDAGDTAYYAFESDAAKTPFSFDGKINEGIQFFGDSANGNFDKRNENLKVFIRTKGKLYGQADTVGIEVSPVQFIAYSFPINETVDLKDIGVSDSDIDTLQPYTGMSITYGSFDREVGGSTYTFGTAVIDGNDASAAQIYAYVQRQLRKSTDIDDGSGTVIGELADSLLRFSGDTLVTSKGVFVDNLSASDINGIQFIDDNENVVEYPFLSSGRFNFNAILQSDPEAVFRLFFEDTYATTSPVTVQDDQGAEIAGTIDGNASLAFTFDYDANNQNGRTPGTDANVVAVAIGTDAAQYVRATGVITRSSGQTLAFVAAQERNFIDPV